jgi:hypothetical protein
MEAAILLFSELMSDIIGGSNFSGVDSNGAEFW